MQTTDNKVFMYGVFGADGFECDALEALFPDEKSAVAYLRAILDDRSDDYLIYGDKKFAVVRVLEVGRRISALETNVVFPASVEGE